MYINKSLQHILMLTPGFPENEADTTCMPPIQLYIKQLAVQYPEITITVLAVWYPYTRNHYWWHGIEVFAMGGKKNTAINYLTMTIKIVRKVWQIRKKKKIDVIHSIWLPSAIFGNLLRRIFRIPHVNTLLGQEAGKKGRLAPFINLSKLHIVAQSEFQSRIFLQTFQRKPDTVIAFGLDTSDFSKSLPTTRTIDIIGVGSLYPVKNFSMFIDIVNQLLPDYPFLKVCIIGGGIQQELLQQKINDLGINQHIELLGQKERNFVLQQMQQSRIFLHTSTYEAQGYVFYEALYAGCYVISFDVGAAKASERWRVCNNDSDMIATIKKLLSGTLEHKVEQSVSINDTVEQYLDLYETLCKQQR